MATVNKAIVGKIIHGNGFYPGDEDLACGPVVRIVRYRDGHGREVYGIVYMREVQKDSEMLFRYDEPTKYLASPEVIWRHPDWAIDGHAVISGEELERTRPAKCVCGHIANDTSDLDQHILASMSSEEDHSPKN